MPNIKCCVCSTWAPLNKLRKVSAHFKTAFAAYSGRLEEDARVCAKCHLKIRKSAEGVLPVKITQTIEIRMENSAINSFIDEPMEVEPPLNGNFCDKICNN
jgi:hypothetical protein